MAGLLLISGPASAAIKNVLVLYSYNRLVPGNIAVDLGLREGIVSTADRPVQIFSEFLDGPEFGGDGYDNLMMSYLREKYAARPPDAIVAVSDEALAFLSHYRSQFFPGAALIHTAVSKSFLATMPSLPAYAVGVPLEYDFLGTIQQAMRWHPDAQRLVVITGASKRDRGWEARLRRDVPGVVGSVTTEFIAGQSTVYVLKRVAELGPKSVVFTPGYFQDADDRLFSPRDAAALIAAASTAPVYGPFETFIGTGAVGGRMPRFEDMGRQAAHIVNERLAGAPPSSLTLPGMTPTVLQVDWRAVKRWGIAESAIPADATVYFREPTFWQTHREEAIAIIAVILIQAALIALLLFEHARRRKAESAVQKQRGELWHASRRAIAGELTASIAHEINQPLGAILTNADAGELLLQSGADRSDDLRRILSDIRRDDLRASDVIRRLRSLLAKQDLERQPFDLNETIADALNLLTSEAQRRRISLKLNTSATATRVIGDRIQIQQVILNLVLNAMDALAQVADDRRVVEVSVESTTHGIAITVRDRGHGIAPEHLPRLFESFFSTKPRGMGLGLSIARTIVESHEGRIWAENGPDNGTAFHVELPMRGDGVALAAHA